MARLEQLTLYKLNEKTLRTLTGGAAPYEGLSLRATMTLLMDHIGN